MVKFSTWEGRSLGQHAGMKTVILAARKAANDYLSGGMIFPI